MATKSAGFGGAGPLGQTQTLVATKAGTPGEKVEQRNVARKPVTLYGIMVDNQKKVTDATLVYVKLYDNISSAWSPGAGEKALLGFPIEFMPGTPIDDTTDLQLKGSYQLMITRSGIPFTNGVSVAAAQEAGDTMTNSPVTDLAVELIHS